MAMIQGIDGSVLLNAFKQGQQDRLSEDKRVAAAERQKQVSGLIGQLFGGKRATVESQMIPQLPGSPSGATPGIGDGQRESFDEAFSPQTMDGLGREERAPLAAPAAPERRPDANVLAQLIVLDPETGGKIASAFKSMDETRLKQLEARNSYMGAAARFIQQGRTPEERQRRFQIAAPELLQAGFTEQELDGIDNDLSDDRLQFYQATAIDYDKMIDNELAEREFQAGKTVAVAPGGNVAIITPDGSARWAIGGGTQAPQPPTEQPLAPQDGGTLTVEQYRGAVNGLGADGAAAWLQRNNLPVQVATPAEARTLPRGTRIILPDGSEGRVP